MMCLLSTASPNSGGTNPNAATNPSATFTTASEFSVHSPDSSSSSSSSGSSSDSSSSTTPSPPQLSPQIKNNSSCSNINQEKNPIFLDLLPKNNKENEEPLVSPPMALLTPQLPNDQQQILTEEPKVVTTVETDIDITIPTQEKRKKVPFTFCNMRQNIFDLKKKRGRKAISKEWKRNNIQPKIHRQLPIYHNTACNNIQTDKPFQSLLQKRKFPNRAESIDDPLNLSPGSKSMKLESQILDISYRRSSAHPDLNLVTTSAFDVYDFEDEIVNDSHEEGTNSDFSSSDDLNLQLVDDKEEEIKNDNNLDHEGKNRINAEAKLTMAIDSKELVKSLISSIINRTFQTVDLSVPLIDVFQQTPLNYFICQGCSKTYSHQDSIFIDLKCQTMHVTCGTCSWWTHRRIGVKSKSY